MTLGTTKIRIFWKRNYLVPSNFSLMRETETKKCEQCCKNSILDLVNTNVSKLPSDKCLFFCKVYYSRIEILKIAHLFCLSFSWVENLREQENLFSRKSGPKVILVSNLHFFSWLFWVKKEEDTTCVWLSSITIVSLKTLSIFFLVW